MTDLLVLPDNNLINVSCRSRHFGFVFPVLIDKSVWNKHYIPHDESFDWIDALLDACACELNTNEYQLDTRFAYASEGQMHPVTLESVLEFDENINPYLLIRSPETIY